MSKKEEKKTEKKNGNRSVTEMKSAFYVLISRPDTADKRISVTKEMPIKKSQTEKQREK